MAHTGDGKSSTACGRSTAGGHRHRELTKIAEVLVSFGLGQRDPMFVCFRPDSPFHLPRRFPAPAAPASFAVRRARRPDKVFRRMRRAVRRAVAIPTDRGWSLGGRAWREPALPRAPLAARRERGIAA
jgi:hypothetical protein